MQVYFLDVDVSEGRNVEKEFKDEFGEGMATFQECDVRDKDKVEGKVVICYAGKYIKLFVRDANREKSNLIGWRQALTTS